jgi:hypothetical protein
MLPTYLVWSFLVVAYEKSSHYVEAAVVTGVAVVALAYVVPLPGLSLDPLMDCRHVGSAGCDLDFWWWAAGIRWSAQLFLSVISGLAAGGQAVRGWGGGR